MYITVTVICFYLTLSLSETVQIKAPTTAANLPLILLEKLLKNCKTLRKVGANRLHAILQAENYMSGQNAVSIEFQGNGTSVYIYIYIYI